MASSPQEDGGNTFFGWGFTVKKLGGGKAIWMMFFRVRGIIRGLVVSIYLKENLYVVNIKFTYGI